MSITSRVKKVLTGNHATAYAVMQARVDVIPAYPITPQTTIVEKLDEFIENGLLDASMIRVESEHSAMAAAIGASAAGARTYTATSSHGLLYMYENLWWAANARLPIVATFVTRAIGPPWNIWSDHQDIFTLRDSGWILFMAKNAQEAYDLTLQAFKIAENPNIRLPVGIGYDGFYISHTSEPVEMLAQDEVDAFLPDKRSIKPLLDPSNPYTIGNLPEASFNFLIRKNMWGSMESSIDYIKKVGYEYYLLTGRNYGDLVDKYRCEDADTIFVSIGAMANEGMVAVDRLRSKGHKVGHMALRLLRPYPEDEVIDSIGNAERIIVMSRAVSMGKGGILFTDLIDVVYRNRLNVDVYDIVVGLAGVEVVDNDFIKVYNDVLDGIFDKRETIFLMGGKYV